MGAPGVGRSYTFFLREGDVYVCVCDIGCAPVCGHHTQAATFFFSLSCRFFSPFKILWRCAPITEKVNRVGRRKRYFSLLCMM